MMKTVALRAGRENELKTCSIWFLPQDHYDADLYMLVRVGDKWASVLMGCYESGFTWNGEHGTAAEAVKGLTRFHGKITLEVE